jgi:putative colanic acid biosynthesis UDP-glucose lipid carrier transferase
LSGAGIQEASRVDFLGFFILFGIFIACHVKVCLSVFCYIFAKVPKLEFALLTRYSKFTRSIYLAGDLVFLNLSFFLSHFFTFGRIYPVEDQYEALLFFLNFTWITGAFIFQIYDIHRVASSRNIILNLLRLLFIHVLLTTAFIVFREGHFYSRQMLLSHYIFLSLSVITWRLGGIYFFRVYRIAGGNYRRIIIIGYGEIARDLKAFFDANPHYGYRFMGFFDDYIHGVPEVKGRIEEVEDFSLKHHVDEIYCSMTDIDNERLNKLIDFSERQLIRVKIIPDFRGISYKKVRLDFYEAFPVLTFREIPLDDALNKVAKRTFDIVFSLLVLLLIGSWLFPLIGLVIRLDSPGPVFFRQRRSGRNNRIFWCFKFRSMRINQESDTRQARRGDERITYVGRILRKTNLDELPQFLNVLLGDMSVVGPRPHPLKLDETYGWIEGYSDRNLVKPGITGLAQVRGHRGETSHPQRMQHRVQMDNFYIEKWSMLLDFKIISMTVSNMIKGDKDAY